MILPDRNESFPVGCTVRIARLPRHHWRIVENYPNVIGAIGTVAQLLPKDEDGDGPWVVVTFGPNDEGGVYRPWWLERGRVIWIPDHDEPVAPR